MAIIDKALENTLITSDWTGVSLIAPATGNLVVGLVWYPGGFSGDAFLTYGGELMDMLLNEADPWSGTWVLGFRLVDGTESSTTVDVDDNGSLSGGTVCGAAWEFDDGTGVTLGDYILWPDFVTQDGVLPETVQMTASLSADIIVEMFNAHYSSTTVLDWTTDNVANSLERANGSSGNRARSMIGTALLATNPTETISGQVGAAISNLSAGAFELTFAAAAEPISLGPRYEVTTRRVNIRELPHQVTSRMFRD